MSRQGSILNKVIKQDFAQEKSTFQQGPGEGEGEIRGGCFGWGREMCSEKERSHRKEKPALTAARESLRAATKTQCGQN